MILKDAQERTRFLRFATVGAIGAAVDFSVFNLLTHFAEMSIISAGVCSFIVAVISNFLWNRFWTYPDSRSKNVGRQMAQFGLVSVVGLGIRTPLLACLEMVFVRGLGNILPKNFIFSSAFLGKNFALAIAILVVMMWNFFANRLWTYNDVQ